MKALLKHNKLELITLGIVVLAMVGSIVLLCRNHLYVSISVMVCGFTVGVLILSFRNTRMVQKGCVVRCPQTLSDAISVSKALRCDLTLGVRSLAYGYVYVCMLIGPMSHSSVPVRMDFAPLGYLNWFLPKEHTVMTLIIIADAACPVCGVLYPPMSNLDPPGKYSRLNEPSQTIACGHWTCRRCAKTKYCSVCGNDVDTRGTRLAPGFVTALMET